MRVTNYEQATEIGVDSNVLEVAELNCVIPMPVNFELSTSSAGFTRGNGPLPILVSNSYFSVSWR